MPDRAERDRGSLERSGGFPPREELPLPSAPPFTAYIGNLAFDLTEGEVSDFFLPSVVS